MIGYREKPMELALPFGAKKIAFELPVAAACTALTATTLLSLIGDTCDLVIESDAQMANIAAHLTDVVKIVDGDVDRNVVIVKINPAKFYTRNI